MFGLHRFRPAIIVVLLGAALVVTYVTIVWNTSSVSLMTGQSTQTRESETPSEFPLRVVSRILEDAPATDSPVSTTSASPTPTTAQVDEGSDSYYARASTRAELKRNIHSGHAGLDAALKVIKPSPSQIARGVLVFLPADSENFNRELRGHYLSIAIMRTTQPADIKTDLLVFTHGSGLEFAKSLGCTTSKRQSFEDPERCIVAEHVPLSARSNPREPLLDYAVYVDSMLILAEFKDVSTYTYLLRSDLDTFLTPGFSNWRLPKGKAIATGKGGYSSDNADHHLGWMMKDKLGLVDRRKTNIGSTWYGDAGVMVAAANMTMATLRWLDTQEFSEFEKRAASTLGWPHWHWHVILLYAGHVVINQIPTEKVIFQTPGVMELDAKADLSTNLRDTVKHIHCWHTERFFSKFKYQRGAYEGLDMTPYAAMRTLQAYAGVIAISVDRMTLAELKAYIDNPSDMRSGKWKRLLPALTEYSDEGDYAGAF